MDLGAFSQVAAAIRESLPGHSAATTKDPETPRGPVLKVLVMRH